MFLTILIILTTIYFLILILAMIFANRLMFFPPAPGYTDTDNHFFKLTLPDGGQISAIYLHNPQAKYTLLYSHGNSEDLGTVQHSLSEYHNAGFSVLSYDYPGYGTSQGRPNQDSVYQSILTAYNHLTHKLSIPPCQIIAYGFSLGCAPTLHLATQKPIAAIILQSPFLSGFRVLTTIKLFPWDRFDNYKKTPLINAPLLIFHGTNDEIIPPYHSRTLYKKAPQPKTYIEIPNADHNNFIPLAGPSYWLALQQFIDSLRTFNRSP